MKKKALIVVLSAILVVGVGVAGTLAWLTASTGTITNTFKTGAIEGMTLTEVKVDENGHKVPSEERVTTNQDFPLYPGAILDKDPEVVIGEGSVPCYVFVKVTNNIPSTVATLNWDANWKPVSGTTDIYVYVDDANAPKVVDAGAAAVTLDKLFTTVTVLETWNGEFEGTPQISVKAYAHQAEVNGTATYANAETAAKAPATWQ